ncbi:thioredoxin family protein [uncultured Aquitalea sp.]|uniref:thioredoxin family protein n=1 Tax=uncultured Aquitalea sp. TaxID=540272 RepID=UPI0025D61210|nr:thioredoxin family protein [uncultured Aquitalea sp.]
MPPPADRRWRLLDEFGFHHALDALPGVTLVLFGQPGCGACRSWQRFLSEWSPARIDHLCQVDVQQSMALARAYDIFHLPALIVFCDGRFHGFLHCPPTRQAMATALDALLAAPPAEEP